MDPLPFLERRAMSYERETKRKLGDQSERQHDPEAEIRRRIDEVLQLVGLEAKHYKMPFELSGGEQQRLVIARALLNKPRLLLADEPTGNLDSTNGAEVMELLRELNGQGTTIVMVTHSERDASFAHRIIHLLDGRVVS